ncbi:MAG: hypothetical protein ACLFRK_01385 [Candidatus Nanohaloarchaea archaeon]
MDREVSGGFVVREKKLLMVESEDGWTVPSKISEPGEISSDTARKAVENVSGLDCTVRKFKSRLKTTYVQNGEDYSWKPYAVEIESEEAVETENGEWVPVKELPELELVPPLEKTAEEVVDRI